jgi:hypothetical protein
VSHQTIVRAAVLIDTIKGATAGITSSGDVLVFRSSDYDNKGNVTGPTAKVGTGDATFTALQLSYNEGFTMSKFEYGRLRLKAARAFAKLSISAKPVSRAGNVARCAICGWRIDDTGDHAPQPDPLGLLGDVCVWCWRTRADRAVAAGREVCARHGGTTWRGGYCDRWATGRSSGPCIVHRLRLRRRETIECEDLS